MSDKAISEIEGRPVGARSLGAPLAAVLSSVAASLCCILPVVAAFGGVGSAALASTFEPYQPWLIALTVIILAWGYYEAFFRSKAVACPDGTCRVPARVRVQRRLLVAATVVAAVAITFPWWVGFVLG